MDAAGHRWLSALANYDFSIIYRPGKTNTDAGVLSRHPGIDKEREIGEGSVKTMCGSVVKTPFDTSVMSVDILEATEFPSQPMAQVDQREIRKQQINDSCLRYWVRLLRDRKLPNKNNIHTWADLTIFKQFNSFKLVRGMLYREVVVDNQKKTQLVLPSSFVKSVLKGLHNDMGHPSKDRTMSLLRDRFFLARNVLRYRKLDSKL